MTLPRNAIAKNINTKKHNPRTNNMMAMEGICSKNAIGDLTMKECKLITNDGLVHDLECSEYKGNLKASVILLKCDKLNETQNVYDVHHVELKKKERDAKKKEEEVQKSKEEIDRVINANKEEIENIPKQEPEKTPTQLKRDKAISRFKEGIEQKQQDYGNRFFRRFMKDIKAKCALEEIKGYRFFETKYVNTFFAAENVRVYRIIESQYIIIVCNLEMKADVLKRIDPTYQSEKTTDANQEFYEKIIEKNNISQ